MTAGDGLHTIHLRDVHPACSAALVHTVLKGVELWTDPDGQAHLIWTRCVQSAGYPYVKGCGRGWLAHRILHEAWHGPLAYGLTIDHLCPYQRCVAPWDKDVVTREENARRAAVRRFRWLRGLPADVADWDAWHALELFPADAVALAS